MAALNLSYLNSIAAGDDAFIREILAMIRHTSMSDLNLLKQAYASSDFTQIGAIVHKLKAPLQMLGDEALNEWIILIESQSKLNQLPEEELLNSLESRIEQLAIEIQLFLNA